ncbi:MAG: PAS domain S-box protein [Clostridiaceae bacterium]|nr:PAS domain S-box protein [Clostridiaceae bacterium]
MKHSDISSSQASDLLRSIVISSTEYAIIATDIDNRIILWNKGAELIYGYLPEEMLGKQMPSTLHKEGSLDNEFLILVDNSLKSKLSDYKVKALRKDASELPVSLTVTPRLDKNNNTTGLLIISRDISKSLYQDKLRDVLLEITYVVNSYSTIDEMCSSLCSKVKMFLDIPTVFICMLDYKNNCFHVNSYAGLCSNCNSHSCRYYSDESMVSDDTRGCFDTYSQFTINSENLSSHVISNFVEDKELSTGDNSIIHIPLTSDASLIGILHIIVSTPRKDFLLSETQLLSLIANEITDGIMRKRLVEEIKDYADNLEKMVKVRTDQLREKDAQLIQSGKLATLGEMAAGIAHEINQPLGGISLIAQGLMLAKARNKLSDELLNEKLDAIIEQVERINRIIGHLRTFARQSDDTKKQVFVKNPLYDSLKLIGEQLVKRKITLELNIEENLPPILADHNKLEQVFLNLIGNARDAIEELEITGRKLKNEKDIPEWLESLNRKIVITVYSSTDYVTIEILDNGIGMPKSIQNKIFEPFFTTKEVGNGTGLGLSITYGIVKEFEGTIEVESTEMKGSKFTLKFPVLRDQQST